MNPYVAMKYNTTYFLTSARIGGSGQLHATADLTQGEESMEPIQEETRWASERT